MQLSSGVEIPDGLLAAMPQLAKNSRQGFESYSGTLHQGFGVVISSTSLGIISPLYDGDVRSRCTGKERDAETGLDNFGARYYGSSMGRFMSPDWATKPQPIPYGKTSNPQSLNLYAYAGNNPLDRLDPNGHNWFTDFFKNTWQRVDNEFHGNGFITNAQRTNITTTETYNYLNNIHNTSEDPGNNEALHNHEPIPSVTAATDAAGLIGVAAPTVTKEFRLGYLGAGLSIANDPSMKNIGINLFGLTDLGAAPMATTTALTDFMDWSVNNSTPGPQKIYGNDRLQPVTIPTQNDGACAAAGVDCQ
jgi:RHS repeat-associated protein